MRIFNHDIMTEWYHHIVTKQKLTICHSLSYRSHACLAIIYFSTFPRHNVVILRNHIQQTVGIIKKNWTKESCYCMYAVITQPRAVCKFFYSSFFRQNLYCMHYLLSSLMSNSTFFFLLHFFFFWTFVSAYSSVFSLNDHFWKEEEEKNG